MEPRLNEQDNSQLHHDSEQKVDGSKIRRHRNWKGWSAKDLAEKVCVDPQHIYRVERNEARPSLALLTKIADCLEVPIQELFELDLSAVKFTTQMIDPQVFNKKSLEYHVMKPSLSTAVSSLCDHNSGRYDHDHGILKHSHEADIMLRGLKTLIKGNFEVKLSIGPSLSFDVPPPLADEFMRTLFTYSLEQHSSSETSKPRTQIND